MAVTEADILRDEHERSNLLRAVSDIESAITISSPGARRVLQNTLENANKRVTTLDKKIEEAKVERETEVRAQTAAAALAAKETKLSAEGREQYRGFLEESYFTKRDFGKLDVFYTHSYDRLSEGGKEEMSKRIHEGIKRGEFKETDLPKSVQKIEVMRSHQYRQIQVNSYANPVSTTNDQVSFQRETDTAKETHLSDSIGRPLKTDIDLGSVDLKDIKLVAAASEPSSALIPNASGQRIVERT